MFRSSPGPLQLPLPPVLHTSPRLPVVLLAGAVVVLWGRMEQLKSKFA